MALRVLTAAFLTTAVLAWLPPGLPDLSNPREYITGSKPDNYATCVAECLAKVRPNPLASKLPRGHGS